MGHQEPRKRARSRGQPTRLLLLAAIEIWSVVVPVEVRLPTLLRKHAGDRSTLQASGSTVGEVFQSIATEYPSLGAQLTGDDGGLHKFMNVYVNDDDVRFLGKLDAKVKDGDSITILPAVAGGVV